MKTYLKWGVLGASKFAQGQMAPAIHAARNAELTALATSSPPKAAGFQAFAPGIRVHDSYDALLADPEIDAVYIPLPNSLHVDWTLKAMDAGKHVLCEKPFALRAEDFDAVIAKRDATGLLAAEAYMIVHHPQWTRAKEILASGTIGRLRHVEGVFTYDNRQDMGNFRNKAELGGGAIPDIGVYPCGATRFATGEEPGEISAHIDFENGVDVFSHVTGRFESFTFSFLNSMRMERRQSMTFHGERGLMTLTAPFNPRSFGEGRIVLETAKNQTLICRFPEADQYVLQVENFGRSVLEGLPYACPLEFSRGTQKMIDRVFAAART